MTLNLLGLVLQMRARVLITRTSPTLLRRKTLRRNTVAVFFLCEIWLMKLNSMTAGMKCWSYSTSKMVEIHIEDIEEIPGINPEILFAWFKNVCEIEKKTLGEITVIFCSDEYLLEMNRTHLSHDYYTDIITFDYSEE